MKKPELISALSERCGITQKDANAFFDHFIGLIRSEVGAGEEVRLEGLGAFKVSHSKERSGYDPIRKVKITIAAQNRVSFKATKSLKELVNR